MSFIKLFFFLAVLLIRSTDREVNTCTYLVNTMSVATQPNLNSKSDLKGEGPQEVTKSSLAKSVEPESDTRDGMSRVDIDGLVMKFQKRLGKKWDDYQMVVSLFLIGKLSRDELMEKLEETLDSTTIRFHNQLLLANLANCLRAEPSDGMSSAGFGSQTQQNKKRKTGRSSQYDMLKRNILSLPIRERRRLKSITRESGKKGMTNSTLALTRQAILPKVPMKAPRGADSQSKEIIAATLEQTGKWSKDVSRAIKAPLCSESFELPDMESLQTRMLGIAREHGLEGSVNPGAAQLLSVGLEYHLKSLIERSLANVKRNENGLKRQRVTLTVEDMYDTLSQVPHSVDNCGSLYYLSDVLLKNDDDASVVHLQRQPSSKDTRHNSQIGGHANQEQVSISEPLGGDRINKEVNSTSKFERVSKGDNELKDDGTIGNIIEDQEKPLGKKRTESQGLQVFRSSSHSGEDMDHHTKFPKSIINRKFNVGEYSPVSFLLKPKGLAAQKSEEKNAGRPNLTLHDPSIGSPNDLNWVISELLSE